MWQGFCPPSWKLGPNCPWLKQPVARGEAEASQAWEECVLLGLFTTGEWRHSLPWWWGSSRSRRSKEEKQVLNTSSISWSCPRSYTVETKSLKVSGAYRHQGLFLARVCYAAMCTSAPHHLNSRNKLIHLGHCQPVGRGERHIANLILVFKAAAQKWSTTLPCINSKASGFAQRAISTLLPVSGR